MTSARLRDTGRFRHLPSKSSVMAEPETTEALLEILDPRNRHAKPLRPGGARSSATDCHTSSMGTSISTGGLDRIVNIDHQRMTVTALAGVRLDALNRALAEEGLELIGAFELTGRTLGGAIAAPCFGPCIGNQGGYLSTSVVSLKLALPNGKLLNVTPQQKNLVGAIRMSYGLLGVIVEATLKVRAQTAFRTDHRRVTIGDFANAAGSLADANVGLQFYLLPHKDRAYLDIRRYAEHSSAGAKTPWAIKDWGESTVLPRVFNSLHKVMPIRGVRFGLIDSISAATHDIVNTRFTQSGSNATSVSGKYRALGSGRLHYSTWCFPASDFGVVLRAYREFCEESWREHGYRCDLPAMGYRIPRDPSALLSPSYDETMVALQTMSTVERGWEDFVIDLAEFAEHWGGTPMFNLTRSASVDHARQAYGPRRDMFNRIRRQLDPDNRLLNPFLAQYFL
jgi:L-gulonolactone oxidase